ncbi:MAG: transglycosylase family protein [Acidimicrobiales bacterium]
MKTNSLHVAFVGTLMALVAVAGLAALVANVGADNQRPTLASAQSVVGEGQPEASDAEPSDTLLDIAEEEAFVSRDGTSATATETSHPTELTAAAAAAEEAEVTTMGEPSASVEQVWAGASETVLDPSTTDQSNYEQVVEATDAVVNTDNSSQQTAPSGSSPAEPETVEVEHTVSRIPDPPDVGASHKREKFVVKPEAHDPWQAVRRCESHDNYQINTGNGFYGAYQFTRSTWDWVAGKLGRQDLVGVRPDLANAVDQDRLAQALAFEVPGGGLHHWPVCGRLYG